MATEILRNPGNIAVQDKNKIFYTSKKRQNPKLESAFQLHNDDIRFLRAVQLRNKIMNRIKNDPALAGKHEDIRDMGLLDNIIVSHIPNKKARNLSAVLNKIITKMGSLNVGRSIGTVEISLMSKALNISQWTAFRIFRHIEKVLYDMAEKNKTFDGSLTDVRTFQYAFFKSLSSSSPAKKVNLSQSESQRLKTILKEEISAHNFNKYLSASCIPTDYSNYPKNADLTETEKFSDDISKEIENIM